LIEIEAKFDLLDTRPEAFDKVLIWLRDSSFLTQTTGPERIIADTYFDTSDFHIETLPGSLRLRQERDDRLLTFKQKVTSEHGVLSRVELEAAPTLDHLDRVRQALNDTGWSIARDTVEKEMDVEQVLNRWGLQPILVVRNTRSSYAILRDAILCCTLTLDRVLFQHDAQSVPYIGIEIEAVDQDSGTQVQLLATDLKLAFPDLLRPQLATKYEMGLRLLHLK
jgi:inorganic triphosphatase YgiF